MTSITSITDYSITVFGKQKPWCHRHIPHSTNNAHIRLVRITIIFTETNSQIQQSHEEIYNYFLPFYYPFIFFWTNKEKY